MILIKQKNGKSIFIAVTKTHDNKKVFDINVWGFIF